MKKVKKSAGKEPSLQDLTGVAWSMVQLQDVFDLPIDGVLDGLIMGSKSFRSLDGRLLLLSWVSGVRVWMSTNRM